MAIINGRTTPRSAWADSTTLHGRQPFETSNPFWPFVGIMVLLIVLSSLFSEAARGACTLPYDGNCKSTMGECPSG
jgi:hypothetical protein